MKKKLTERPIFDLLDFGKVFQVDCDANGIAIRFVLTQEGWMIAFFSENIDEDK